MHEEHTLTVEGGLVQHHGHVALGDLVHSHLIHDEGDDAGGGAQTGVAGELGSGQTRNEGLGGVGPTADVGSCGAGALTLGLHQFLEGLLVDGQPLLLRDLARS